MPSDETDLVIEQVNSANLTWKANTCLLQKHHPEYDHKHCERKKSRPVSLAQVDADAQAAAMSQALATARAWSQTYATADEIPDEKIPAVYDLRHVNGQDLTSPVRDQVHCGSCHVMSFIQVVEQRLKLKTGKDVQLSPQ